MRSRKLRAEKKSHFICREMKVTGLVVYKVLDSLFNVVLLQNHIQTCSADQFAIFPADSNVGVSLQQELSQVDSNLNRDLKES